MGLTSLKYYENKHGKCRYTLINMESQTATRVTRPNYVKQTPPYKWQTYFDNCYEICLQQYFLGNIPRKMIFWITFQQKLYIRQHAHENYILDSIPMKTMTLNNIPKNTFDKVPENNW